MNLLYGADLVTHGRYNRVAVIAEDQVPTAVHCPEEIGKLIGKLHSLYHLET